MCSFSILYAENIQEYTTKNGSKETIIQPDMGKVLNNDLFKILMFSCNDGIKENKLTKQFILQARPWQEKKICLLVYNTLKRKVDLTLSFYQWEKDKENVFCWNMSAKDNFSPLVQDITWWTFWLSLLPEQQIVKNFEIKIPQESTGNIYWCIWATIDGAVIKNTGDMLGIVVRKPISIAITVTWSVYKFWRIDDIHDIYIQKQSSILKIIISILVLWLVTTIFYPGNKKKKGHTKKNQNS